MTHKIGQPLLLPCCLYSCTAITTYNCSTYSGTDYLPCDEEATGTTFDAKHIDQRKHGMMSENVQQLYLSNGARSQPCWKKWKMTSYLKMWDSFRLQLHTTIKINEAKITIFCIMSNNSNLALQYMGRKLTIMSAASRLKVKYLAEKKGVIRVGCMSSFGYAEIPPNWLCTTFMASIEFDAMSDLLIECWSSECQKNDITLSFLQVFPLSYVCAGLAWNTDLGIVGVAVGATVYIFSIYIYIYG